MGDEWPMNPDRHAASSDVIIIMITAAPPPPPAPFKFLPGLKSGGAGAKSL
jgi:hypothetical protein